MRTIEVIAGIRIRQLTADDREKHFRTPPRKLDLAPYLAVVREMEGGSPTPSGLNGDTPRAVRIRLGKAARELDLKLRYAKPAEGADELVVELKA